MQNLTVTDYKGIRVLTTQQIAEAYGTDSKTISYNFNHNKERYTEGKHYILLAGEELRSFRENHELSGRVPKLYLWTKKGAFLHAKSLNTDVAWEVYDRLVDSYFDNHEKSIMNPLEGISPELQAVIVVDKRVTQVEQKVSSVKQELEDFKLDMPLLAVECERITTAVHRRGVDALGGKDSNAYKDSSLRGKVYQDIHRELKRQFGVSTYKAIKRSQCDLAVSIIEEYELPIVLQEQIINCNAQINMEVA